VEKLRTDRSPLTQAELRTDNEEPNSSHCITDILRTDPQASRPKALRPDPTLTNDRIDTEELMKVLLSTEREAENRPAPLTLTDDPRAHMLSIDIFPENLA
jgi:hypothetical protein